MKNKVLRFAKSPFIRNVVILTSGTAVSQIIGMVLSPVITRLYGPEAYGLMGTFLAIISIISPVAALTYPISIVLPKNTIDAKGLIKISLTITIFISFVSGIILLFFNKPITKLFGLEKISTFLYLIPIVLISAGFLQVMEQWLIRTNQFQVTARSTFIQSVLVNGGKAVIGILHPKAWVLILFSALTEGIRAFLMFVYSRGSILRNPSNFNEKRTPILTLVKRYKDFPLYRAPQTFVNAVSESIPVLLLASFFGAASVGFYNIGRTVLNIPTQLIGKSIGDVFYPNISKIANEGKSVSKTLKKATLFLMIIGIIPYGTVILTGPALFSFVFGGDWYVAGEYASWIGLWSFSSLILQPAVRALPVLSAQRLHLIYTIISLIIRILVLWIGNSIFLDDLITIALFGITSSIMNFILILITIKISQRFDSNNVVQ